MLVGNDPRVPPMPMSVETLRQHLIEAFPDAEIAIDDLAGDGDHYRARIVSSAFEGMPRVRQHQLVYAALKGQADLPIEMVLPSDQVFTRGTQAYAQRGGRFAA